MTDAPPSLPAAGGSQVITGFTARGGGEECRFYALERVDGPSGTPAHYAPVVFVRRDKVTAADRLRVAFAAAVLARVQRVHPQFARVVHGPKFTPMKLDLAPPARRARLAADAAGALADHPPPVVLNRQCPECEYRDRCRGEAVARDDLSLLQGLAGRHGGDPAVLARLTERAVNVLGAIQCRVFFPTHGNGLKAVAAGSASGGRRPGRPASRRSSGGGVPPHPRRGRPAAGVEPQGGDS